MATGVLGLGSGQATALNSDLINKLKTAETTATITPIETSITKIATEKTTFSSISTKVSELLASIKPFDLFISGGVTAFEQKTATTSGDSVTFDSADVKSLKKGSTTVNVSKLAQKDVYQSEPVGKTDVPTLTSTSPLIINNKSYPPSGTTYKSYDELVSAINDTQSGVNASFEEVNAGSYKLVLKSESTGVSNKLDITINEASTALGYTKLDTNTNTVIINESNHVLSAQNMNATVDGVAYNVATNSITVDGLKITANKVDTNTSSSSINVTEDNTQLETQMNNFITKYNELVALVDISVQNSDSTLGDKAAIRSLVTGIKDKLFGSYGSTGNKSVFNYGIQLDKYGGLSLDSTKFNSAVQNDKAGLKDLFAGTAEKKGLGTTLKETLDGMTFSGGILDTYQKTMLKRETTLNTNKTTAQDVLDKKYQLLSNQFAAYGVIINQMETSFSGLKAIINSSTSSN